MHTSARVTVAAAALLLAVWACSGPPGSAVVRNDAGYAIADARSVDGAPTGDAGRTVDGAPTGDAGHAVDAPCHDRRCADSGLADDGGRPDGSDLAPTAPDPSTLLELSRSYSRANATRPLLRFDFDDNSWGSREPNLAATTPRTGTLVGGAKLTQSATDGRFGRALLLDGVNDHLVVHDPKMLDGLAKQLTVQAWVYADNLDSPMMRIVSRWSVAEVGKRFFNLSVYQRRPYFVVSTDGTEYFNLHGTAEIRPRVWTHIAGVCDGKTLRLYLDKQLHRTVDLPSDFAFPRQGGNLVIGNRDETEHNNRWVGMIDEVSVYGVAREAFGRAYRATVPTVVRVGERFDVQLAVLRESGEPNDRADETLLLSEPDGAVTFPRAAWPFGSAHSGVQVASGLVCSKPGIRRLSVSVRGQPITAESNPFYCAAVLPHGREVAWGDMHWHTSLGRKTETQPHALGSPDDGYRYARHIAALDFAGMAEHAFRLQSPSADWRKQINAANRHHDPGRFVTILGYEWRGEGVSSGRPWGHHIVRFPGFDPSQVTDPRRETAAEVRYDAGVNVPALAIPGAAYLSLIDESPLPWDLSRDDTSELPQLWRHVKRYWATVTPHMLGLQRLDRPTHYPVGAMPYVEIYSKVGASELRGNKRRTIDQDTGGPLAQDALRNGFVLGFVGGSDTHLTTPGASTVEVPPKLQYRHPGRTACLVTAKTRKAVWRALTDRQCYAASGERILVLFSVDQALPGSQITIAADRAPVIDVVAAGTTKLKVELLRDNQVILVREPDAAIAGFRYVDTGLGRKAYYYVRVTQVDGERAWISPIWVSRS